MCHIISKLICNANAFGYAYLSPIDFHHNIAHVTLGMSSNNNYIWH